jgi:hypothetical protein
VKFGVGVVVRKGVFAGPVLRGKGDEGLGRGQIQDHCKGGVPPYRQVHVCAGAHCACEGGLACQKNIARPEVPRLAVPAPLVPPTLTRPCAPATVLIDEVQLAAAVLLHSQQLNNGGVQAAPLGVQA